MKAGELLRRAWRRSKSACRCAGGSPGLALSARRRILVKELVDSSTDDPLEHSKSPLELIVAKHFSWLETFLSADNPTSSRLTQERLGCVRKILTCWLT